jgi:Na+-transporting methylmalonyl-CoA/oxaloacetate decarboxylase gamma subunit
MRTNSAGQTNAAWSLEKIGDSEKSYAINSYHYWGKMGSQCLIAIKFQWVKQCKKMHQKLYQLFTHYICFFLLVLVLSVKLSCRFLSAGSARELAEIEAAELNKKKQSFMKTDDLALVAVISAALAAHRSRTRLVR